MYPYNVWQWFLFFYIYCFLGWVWETCYVSIKSRQFQNRGFMDGPFLPIYGFGAMSILLAAIPVRNFPVLVFFFGMISSTVLELFTGIGMLKLFHVRYWDYSKNKFNYKGHVCLKSSIAWGVFSLILIYGVHKSIENIVGAIPQGIGNFVTLVLTFIIAADFSTSFKTALELKNMLVSYEEIKKQLERLERRAEIMETFLHDSLEKKSEALEAQIEEIVGKIEATREDILEEMARTKQERNERLVLLKTKFHENKSVVSLLRRNPQAVSVKYEKVLDEYRAKFVAKVKELGERK